MEAATCNGEPALAAVFWTGAFAGAGAAAPLCPGGSVAGTAEVVASTFADGGCRGWGAAGVAAGFGDGAAAAACGAAIAAGAAASTGEPAAGGTGALGRWACKLVGSIKMPAVAVTSIS